MNRRCLKKMLYCALTAGFFFSLAASARAYICTGTLSGGTYTDILVPAGDTCTLQGVTVTGNIVVQSGGSLYFLEGPNSSDVSSVSGNLITVGASAVCLYSGYTGAIGGNVIAIGSGSSGVALCEVLYPFEVLCPTKVSGNVAILDTANVIKRTLWDFCAGSPPITVGGNFEFANNAVSTTIKSDTIRGNLLFNDNTAGGTISHNTIGGNLECSGNTPPPSGSGNIVSGAMLGQCAGF
jgi:hypothetical protein